MSKDAAVTRAQDWLEQHKHEMISALQRVLRIPSVEGEPATNAPFGVECRRALDHTLELAATDRFRTRDFDGYAGDAEFGDGEEVVMALGHLDVVPIDPDGWKHEPFGAEIDQGYIYARGAADDKGPTFAAYFAARALMESGAPLKRRVRLVFGCNEESGFRCVKHYFSKEAAPTYGFAPDAGWPLVYAEKGIASLTIEGPAETGTGLRLISAQGGQRPNMVPALATAVVEGDLGNFVTEYWDKNITIRSGGRRHEITAIGKASHGANPWGGDNACTRLLRCLAAMPFENKKWLDALVAFADPAGTHLGYDGREDVTGSLTSNFGVLRISDGKATALYNVRYPVTWQGDELVKRSEASLTKAGFKVADFSDSKPLHVPVDQEPVKTLLAVYREETGDMAEPETMGGGTYARAVPHCVAVGAGFEGDGPAHENDERYAIDSYMKCARIYAHMLYRLANV